MTKNKNGFSVKTLLKKGGDQVYYFPLTNEILVLHKKPRKGEKLEASIVLNKEKSISLGFLEYIGKL